MISHIGKQLRTGRTRSGSTDPHTLNRYHLDRPLPPTPPPEPEPPEISTSSLLPVDSPGIIGDGLIPAPKARPLPISQPLAMRRAAGSGSQPLDDLPINPSEGLPRPKADVDLALPLPADFTARLRSNSETAHLDGSPPDQISTSSPSHSNPQEFQRQYSSGSLSMRKRNFTTDHEASQSLQAGPTMYPSKSLPPPHSTNHNNPEDNRHSFVSFLRGIPHWLHQRNVSPTPRTDGLEEGRAVRRHQKGEVVGIYYGTVDDAG